MTMLLQREQQALVPARACLIFFLLLTGGGLAALLLSREPDRDISSSAPLTKSLSFFDSVDRIDITTSREPLSLRKNNGIWTEHATGYPAWQEKMTSFLFFLERLTVSQEISPDQENYKRLGLSCNQPTKETLIVTLWRGEKKEKSFTFGKPYFPEYSDQQQDFELTGSLKGTYRPVLVEEEGESRAFFAPAGRMSFSAAKDKWLSPFILAPSNQSILVKITPPHGESFQFSRKRFDLSFSLKEANFNLPWAIHEELDYLINPGLLGFYDIVKLKTAERQACQTSYVEVTLKDLSRIKLRLLIPEKAPTLSYDRSEEITGRMRAMTREDLENPRFIYLEVVEVEPHSSSEREPFAFTFMKESQRTELLKKTYIVRGNGLHHILNYTSSLKLK